MFCFHPWRPSADFQGMAKISQSWNPQKQKLTRWAKEDFFSFCSCQLHAYKILVRPSYLLSGLQKGLAPGLNHFDKDLSTRTSAIKGIAFPSLDDYSPKSHRNLTHEPAICC